MDLFLVVSIVIFAAIVVCVKDLFFSNVSYVKIMFESLKTFMFNKSSMYVETKENANYELTDRVLNIVDDIVDEICLNVNTKTSDVIDALEIKLNDIIKENLYYAKTEVSDKNWIIIIHEKITNALFEMNLICEKLDINDVIKEKLSKLLECNMVVNLDDEKIAITETLSIVDPTKKQYSDIEKVFVKTPTTIIPVAPQLNKLKQIISDKMTETKRIENATTVETVDEKLPTKQVKTTKTKTAKKAIKVIAENKKTKKSTPVNNVAKKTTKKVVKKKTGKK